MITTKSNLLLVALLFTFACGSEQVVEKKDEVEQLEQLEVVDDPEDLSADIQAELDRIKSTYLTHLLQIGEVSISSASFQEYIKNDWNITTYPIDTSEDFGETGRIKFLDTELDALDDDLRVFGITFETYATQIPGEGNNCEEIVTDLVSGDILGSGFGIGGTDYAESYEIVDTGFDILLKVNVQANSYSSCCGDIGACAEAGVDPPPPSEILTASKSFVIEAADDNGFVIISQGYYVVFDIL